MIYVVNLNELANIGNQWIAIYVENNEAKSCDGFGVNNF